MDDIDIELWMPVAGYEGLYSVSNLGRVRSEDREVACRDGGVRRQRAFIRKVGLNDDGYLVLNLSKDAKKRKHRVHVLVAAAFIGPRPEGMEVAHNDGSRAVSRLDNLRYDTHTGNMRDRVAHGTRPIRGAHGRFA